MKFPCAHSTSQTTVIISLLCLPFVGLFADTVTWTGATNKFWGQSSNWDTGAKPTASDEAFFGSTSSSFSVDLGSANRSVDSLTIDSNTAYTFADQNPGQALHTNGLSVVSGTGHTFNIPVEFTSAATVSVASGADLTLNGIVSGTANVTKSGAGTLKLTGTNSYTGETIISEGSILLDNLTGSLTNQAGTVSLGTSGASLATIGDDFTQSSGGRLEIEIGSNVAGSGYDQLQVADTVSLAGTLDVTFLNNYTPVDGDSFTIVTGASITDAGLLFNTPTLQDNFYWEVEWTSTSLTLNIEADSLAIFRNTYGLSVDGAADAQDWSGNGLANIFYYAFGLGDPSEAIIDYSKLPALSIAEDGTISYAYSRLIDTTELTYTAYSSFDLEDWVDLDGDFPELSASNEGIEIIDADYERRTLDFSTTEPKAFFHLDVFDPQAALNYINQNHQPSLSLNYYISTQGEHPFAGGHLSPAVLSEVKLFATGTEPAGYLPAEGQLLPINQYGALYSLIGDTFGGDNQTTFALPDLRGRTPIGDGSGPGLSNRTLGDTGGVDEVTLMTIQLPSHSHSSPEGELGLNGTGESHSNMQPFVVLKPIIRTSGGNIPADGIICTGEESVGYLGEIKWLATSLVPVGWTEADGQILPIASNSDLYALLQTTYGGDGRATFGLPDLRGRAAMAAGTGLGLSERTAGIKLGEESSNLSIAQMPEHTHPLVSGEVSGATGLGEAHSNMMPSLALNYMLCSTTQEVRAFAVPDFIIGLSLDGASDRPDLRGRIPIGSNTTYPYLSILGSETTILTHEDLPTHTHSESGTEPN